MERIYPLYRLSHWFYRHHLTPLTMLIRIFMRILFSCDISYKAKIGKGTSFPHDALGIIIHPNTVIGDNCKILHGVTIGGRSNKAAVPCMGNHSRSVLVRCCLWILPLAIMRLSGPVV